mmetsp:Transcript_1098/g.2451  ORF Transcript_1098/g.2451 Transcript_1098/m.2451 type:complete len:232 (-) Transcript_1098:185-880(-)
MRDGHYQLFGERQGLERSGCCRDYDSREDGSAGILQKRGLGIDSKGRPRDKGRRLRPRANHRKRRHPDVFRGEETNGGDGRGFGHGRERRTVQTLDIQGVQRQRDLVTRRQRTGRSVSNTRKLHEGPLRGRRHGAKEKLEFFAVAFRISVEVHPVPRRRVRSKIHRETPDPEPDGSSGPHRSLGGVVGQSMRPHARRNCFDIVGVGFERTRREQAQRIRRKRGIQNHIDHW